MKIRKSISFLVAILLLASVFTGCASENKASTPPATTAPASAAPTDTPSAIPDINTLSYEEGTSPADDIVKTIPADKVLLVVSFGTSYNQSRSLTIGGIEAAMKEAYPEYQIRRAFSSQIIIDKLAERDKLQIDNVEAAMNRLVLDKVKEVVVQPATIMTGFEYDDIVAEVMLYADKFESLKIGKPLLSDDSDFDAVADIIVQESESRYPDLSRIAENAGVRAYGYMPRRPEWEIKSRHLGLLTANEISGLKDKLAELGKQAEQTIDINGLLELAGTASALKAAKSTHISIANVRLAVAKDEAFCFHYQENLELFQSLGCELVLFSPLRDNGLPSGISGLYLCGGYPELYKEA